MHSPVLTPVIWIGVFVLWLAIGVYVMRITKLGEVIAMLHGDRAYAAAYVLLIYAIVCWPVAKLSLYLIFGTGPFFEWLLKKLTGK